MFLKSVLLGGFMMCSVAVGHDSATGKLPVVLEENKSIRIDLPKDEGIGSKPLLKVEIQIQNATAGSEIIIEDASTGELVGIISPFGKTGRNATESFLVPLRKDLQDKPLPLNFELKQSSSDTAQKITIESVKLQSLE